MLAVHSVHRTPTEATIVSLVVAASLVLPAGAGAALPSEARGRTGARVGHFERGDFREFDGWSAANGTLSVTRRHSYDGHRAAKATTRATGNQFQRVWYRVRWRDGADVWYGLALLIPRLSAWCWWEPARWDNYLTYGPGGDVGGVRIAQRRLYVERSRYHSDLHTLIGPVAIPEGRWLWVEVHQRLSATPGRALSELYVDGVLRGRSRAPNSAGRVINHIRYGNVALASRCSGAGSIYFDRVSLSRRPLGPRR